MVDGFASVGKWLTGATITVKGASGKQLASVKRRTGARGYFWTALRGTAPRLTFVSAKGGLLGGQLFPGTLSAEVARYKQGEFVYLSAVSTLIAAYAKAHPHATTAAATARVEAFLKIPAGTPLSSFVRPSRLFNGSAFLAAAAGHGGFNAYVRALVRKMARRSSTHAFPGKAANDVLSSIAGVFVSRLTTTLLNKACAAGGLENILAALGQCSAEAENNLTQQALNNISTQLSGLQVQLASVSSNIATTNYDTVFGINADTGQTKIGNEVNDAFNDVTAMSNDVSAGLYYVDDNGNNVSVSSPSQCQNVGIDDGGSTCKDYHTKHGQFNADAQDFEQNNQYTIYDGLTDTPAPDTTQAPTFSSTFIGATQGWEQGSLTTPYANQPIITPATNAVLIQAEQSLLGLQALEYDVILIYEKSLSNTVCPPMTLANPTSTSNLCQYAQQYVYDLAQETLPQLTISPLPQDLLADTRTGLLWNSYPLQTCDTFWTPAQCAGNSTQPYNGDIPNPDPGYGVSSITDATGSATCQAEQTNTSDGGDVAPGSSTIPTYQWTELPGSCLHDYSATQGYPWQQTNPNGVGETQVFSPETIGPVFAGSGKDIFLADWSQEIALIGCWSGACPPNTDLPQGTIWQQLRYYGFQDVEGPTGPWSWLTSPGDGQQARLDNGYPGSAGPSQGSYGDYSGPGCASGHFDESNGYDYAPTFFWDTYGSCFEDWNFGLQSGWPAPDTYFYLTPSSFKNLPAPTQLPPTATVSTSVSSAAGGNLLTVNVKNFSPGETVQVALANQPIGDGIETLTKAPTDATGSASIVVRLPYTTVPGAKITPGKYYVLVTGLTSYVQAAAPLTITG